MRNLLQYPITQKEVIDTLQDHIDAIMATGCIGGTQASILASLQRIVEREFRHDDFNPIVKETDGKSEDSE